MKDEIKKTLQCIKYQHTNKKCYNIEPKLD